MTYPVSQLMSAARTAATLQGVDPALFMGLCDHESGGWRWAACRYEPAFYARYIEPMVTQGNTKTFGLCSPTTEAQFRATSWGLGQIMGQTAREYGFDGEFLSELLDPETGCKYACKKLAHCITLHPGNVPAALLSFNGGSNLGYPDLVMGKMGKYQTA